MSAPTISQAAAVGCETCVSLPRPMKIRLRGAAIRSLRTIWGNDDGRLVFHSVAILDWGRNVGRFAPRFRKLVREEKQISNPDRSFYRRNDNDLLRLIFYYIVWCLIPALLFSLWLYMTGQLHTWHGT